MKASNHPKPPARGALMKGLTMDTLQKAGLLQLLPKMKKIDAMQCMLNFQAVYDYRIDWHEFSPYLAELAAKGILSVSRPGGMTQYRLNENA